MTQPPRTCLAAAAFVLCAVGLTGCGGSDGSTEPPAICSSVDALKSSSEDLKKVDVAQNGLADLTDRLTQVQSDLKKVTSDAKKEYATEADSVNASASSLGTSLEAAVAAPTAATIAAVGAAVRALMTSLTELESAVKNSC